MHGKARACPAVPAIPFHPRRGTGSQRKHNGRPAGNLPEGGRCEGSEGSSQRCHSPPVLFNSGSTRVSLRTAGHYTTRWLSSQEREQRERSHCAWAPSYRRGTFFSPNAALQELQSQPIYSRATATFENFPDPRNLHSPPQGGTGVSTAICGDEYGSVCIDLANYSDKNKAQLRVHFLSAVLKSAALNLVCSRSGHGFCCRTHDSPVGPHGHPPLLTWAPLTNLNPINFT